MPYCDKYRLGTCCGERHCVPFSRLHAKPKALYKAVVDATADDERAAAVTALEEYEGSNGACSDCQNKNRSDDGAAAFFDKTRERSRGTHKCSDPFGKGCKNLDPSHKKQPCPDCKEEQKRRAAGAST